MSDCISRQEALNEWNRLSERGRTEFDQVLMMLPSAQPEPSTEIQEILEYLDTTLHPIVSPDNWYVYAELHDMVNRLPSVQPEQQWIPCSERLPEKNRKPNTFLVADSDGKLSISKFYFPLSNSDIEKPYWSGMIDVVAWMPLPEPYKDAQ